MDLETIIRSSRFTILLGKNGAGKSTLLRSLDSSGQINSMYISPERGGSLKYDPNVDSNITLADNWLINTRRRNLSEQFRQQSAAQFRNLEVLILREIEKDEVKRKNIPYTFDTVIEKINHLLPAIRLVRSDKGFSINSKVDGAIIGEEQISSGESELIALAIEVLVFSRSEKIDKVLLLDEPDVHLHPDLQHKFISFVESIVIETDMRIVIATHSTAIISSFSKDADLQIIPISHKAQESFSSFRKSDISNAILPIFGVHPLSTMFNHSPIVLIEGEDDKRVLEQAVRSGKGKFTFSPCVVGTVTEMNEWESWLNEFLPVIYDAPKAFSFRDLDDSQQNDIDDFGLVCRVRLNCYAIENLLLTDECQS